MQPRAFTWALLAICLLALIPRLILGMTDVIQYDGYWHIFLATQDSWRMFVAEWKRVAHPPLYYLLLRGLAKAGQDPLLYRSLSILPGIASIYVLGRIAARLSKSSGMALLAAAAYGFSLTIIELDCDVRAYPLSLLFVLCAFYGLLEALAGPEERIGLAAILFGIGCALAILTEYMAIFFFLAVLVVVPLLALRFPEVRGRLLRVRPGTLAVPLVPPFAAMIWLYLAHVRFQPGAQGHVQEFYRARGTSILDFVLRNLRNEVNFLSPLEINSLVACVLLTVGVIGAMIYLNREGRKEQVAPAALGLILFGILAELIVLALVRRYPFGGFARQQSILFPFVVLTAFWLFDFASARFPRALRAGAHVLIALLITASFAHGWSHRPRYEEDLFTREHAIFQQILPGSQAVYLDQFSLIGYFIHHRDWQWEIERHYREPDRMDEYGTVSPSGESRVVVRNVRKWSFDLLRPETYATLARLMREARLPGIDVFHLRQSPRPLDAAALEAGKQRFRDLAKAAGLAAGPIHDDGRMALLRLRWRAREH